MAQPVWTLSVDLQTKTATFQTGMADAARSAKDAFSEIKGGAAEMGAETGYSMTEARHGVMLLGEEFGVHLPRGITSFIASLGPVGAAMEAAFPFLAIIVGATLLLEHLAKLRAEGQKLTESQENFGTVVANVLNGLNDKLLQAGIRTDELNHNHLAALDKQLKLIDHASMNELARSFDTVAKAADETFKHLETHWYQWGAGSAGAQASLERFKRGYDSLLAKRDDKGAQAFLDAVIEREEKILALKKQANESQTHSDRGGQSGDYAKYENAKLSLKQMGLDLDKVNLASQEQLVNALQAQLDIAKEQGRVKQQDKDAATQSADTKISGDADKAAREAAQSQKIELELQEKQREEAYKLAVAGLQQSEKEKIDATKQGSAARLAAIDAAIKEENGKGLQETGFYRTLLTQRVELVRTMATEQAKASAEAAKESAESQERMGMLALAHDKEMSNLRLSAMRNSELARLQAETEFAQKQFAIQMVASAQMEAGLDKTDKDYLNKLKAMQDKQRQLVQAFENQITQIKVKAEEERNSRILAAEHRFDDTIASGLTKVMMRQESFAKMMVTLGDQVVGGLIQNAIKSILAEDMTKEHDAAAAARKAYVSGMSMPPPANVVIAPAWAALAFTSVMAFESGGIVPGVGKGDIQPAMLEPGEGVLSKKQMEKLSHGGDNGGSSAQEVHIHHHTTNTIHAIDGASVRGMLDKHGAEFDRHVNNHLRKLNK
jgi:hypothetical protein